MRSLRSELQSWHPTPRTFSNALMERWLARSPMAWMLIWRVDRCCTTRLSEIEMAEQGI